MNKNIFVLIFLLTTIKFSFGEDVEETLSKQDKDDNRDDATDELSQIDNRDGSEINSKSDEAHTEADRVQRSPVNFSIGGIDRAGSEYENSGYYDSRYDSEYQQESKEAETSLREALESTGNDFEDLESSFERDLRSGDEEKNEQLSKTTETEAETKTADLANAESRDAGSDDVEVLVQEDDALSKTGDISIQSDIHDQNSKSGVEEEVENTPKFNNRRMLSHVVADVPSIPRSVETLPVFPPSVPQAVRREYDSFRSYPGEPVIQNLPLPYRSSYDLFKSREHSPEVIHKTINANTDQNFNSYFTYSSMPEYTTPLNRAPIAYDDRSASIDNINPFSLLSYPSPTIAPPISQSSNSLYMKLAQASNLAHRHVYVPYTNYQNFYKPFNPDYSNLSFNSYTLPRFRRETKSKGIPRCKMCIKL